MTQRPEARKWVQHPQSPLHILCVEGAVVKIYAWSDWSEIATMPIDISIEGESLKSVTSHISSGLRQWILLETAELNGSTKTTGIHLLDASLFSVEVHADNEDTAMAGHTKNIQNKKLNKVEAAESTMSPRSLQLDDLAQHAAHLIGYSDNGRLVFLDTKSWVCSADLENLGTSSLSYSKHFFVPYDWFSGVRNILCAVVKKNILFARNDGIAIIKGGLEYMEKVQVEIDIGDIKGGKKIC